MLYTIETLREPKEVAQIEQELTEGGYLSRKKQNRGGKAPKKKAQTFAPRMYALVDGFVAQCGRNNAENDALTHRYSVKSDLWFHARNVPGSHVVVQLRDGQTISEQALEQAAQIAAFHSSAGKQPRVAVDYTTIKYVKKQQGGHPGMVHYFSYQTILVEPRLPMAQVEEA